MKHPTAFSVWILLALLSFLYAYSGMLIYDLDGSFLCVHENKLYGKIGSTQIMPASEISKFDIQTTRKRYGRSCRLLVIGNDGQCLRSDVLDQDASRFQVGLQRALLEHPTGTFHAEHTTTLLEGWIMVVVCMLIAFYEGFAIKGK